MKKTILSIAIVAVFAACNSNPKQISQAGGTNVIPSADTSGLAAYQQFKESQSIIEGQGVEEFTEDLITPETKQAAPTVIYRSAPAKAPRVVRSAPRASTPKPVYQGTRTSTTRPSNTGTSGTGTDVSGGGTGNDLPVVVTQPSEEPVAKKEGWSKAAKGTAIGAGSGAVLGAIISKNKGKGAIIGGVVGAAGGYVLGRVQDKKDGRY